YLFFFLLVRLPPRSTLFPYTTLFRSLVRLRNRHGRPAGRSLLRQCEGDAQQVNEVFMLRKLFAAGAVAGVITVAWALHSGQLATLPVAALRADEKSATPPNGVAMFGHDVSRNMVNLSVKNLPDDWDVGQNTNIKWVAKLGTRAYGGPTVSGGKIYVGTNNYAPRNQRDTRLRKDGKREPIDKGILMCFEEASGKFLWQHVNEKLPSGQVNDWPHEGVCSTPAVEGDRVYYVSNRCEVVCLDANGFADGN